MAEWVEKQLEIRLKGGKWSSGVGGKLRSRKDDDVARSHWWLHK